MDPIKTIGHILNADEIRRDAVHMAIAPVVAGEDLQIGDCLRLNEAGEAVECNKAYGPIGVVDPFLKMRYGYDPKEKRSWSYAVKKGERFWIFLNPGSITSLCHQWQHPAFDEPGGESEAWLRKFARKWNFDYDEMLVEAVREEGCIAAMGFDLHDRSELAPGDEREFWSRIRDVTGFEADDEHRESFGWSCSC